MSDLPYFERQVGGNCRIHAINSLFAGGILTAEKLKEYSVAFDNRYESAITFEFDGVQSDTLTLVSYVIEDMTDYRTLMVSPGQLQSVLDECNSTSIHALIQEEVPAVLVFNDHHIWTIRRHRNEWWNLDSMGGRPKKLGNGAAQHLDRLRRQKIGFIFIYEGEGIQTKLIPLLSRRLKTELDNHGSMVENWSRGETPLFAFLRLFVHENEAIEAMYLDVVKTFNSIMQDAEARHTKIDPLVTFAQDKLSSYEFAA